MESDDIFDSDGEGGNVSDGGALRESSGKPTSSRSNEEKSSSQHLNDDNDRDADDDEEVDDAEEEDDDEEDDDENEEDEELDQEDNDEEEGDDKVAAANDDEDDDDEEEKALSHRRKKEKGAKRKRETDKAKKTKKKRRELKFFSDLAEEGDDDDEEGYEDRELDEVVAGKDEQAAIDAVERRHAKNREMQEKSAEELARRYEEMDRRERVIESRRRELEQHGIGARPTQQSLLPKPKDPKLFKVKCRQGQEQIAIRAILLKSLDMHRKDGFFKVKSAFTGDVKSYIYVEAVTETFAKEVIGGLRMIFFSSLTQVPITDMPSTLAVTATKRPLQVGQWVRLKRGSLKGDLARIIQLYEGGAVAIIQAIPRPDYTTKEERLAKTSLATKSKVRPPQRLFDAEQARIASNGNVFRRHFPELPTEQPFDMWEGEYYRDGFLFKRVNVSTFLSEEPPEPKLEELQFFLNSIKESTIDIIRSDLDNRDRDQDDMVDRLNNKSLNEEIAAQIHSIEEEKSKNLITFAPGDYVLVVGGELQNLVAKVVAVDDIRKIATLSAANTKLSGHVDVEYGLLVKHVTAGAHVKVLKGRYIGQTGRVVSVLSVDGVLTAAILTDGTNNEIQVNVSFLQQTTEVAGGLGNLMGYEMYDLVMLNENESAMVINILVERLRVINHLENVKDISPQEVRSKQNLFSSRSKSYDAQQNVISCGDTMNVISGPHAKQTGTIKHIMKGTLWLHSNSYLKNSGIFVVKARNCVVAGGRANAGGLAMNPMGMGNKAGGMGATTPIGMPLGGGRLGGRDPLLNTTVRIKKGAYKGLLGRVVDVTGFHYLVELTAKMKKVTVKKDDVLPADDRVADSRGFYGGDVLVPDTPYLTSSTPAHMAGAETPNYLGGETPMWMGNVTPHAPETYDDYAASAGTDVPAATPQLSYSTPAHTPSTPSSTAMMAPPAAAPTVSSSSGGIDFLPGMVIVMKKGELMGRLAVITQPPDELHYCMCKLRDGQGRLNTDELRVSVTEIDLAEPQKNSFVVVLSGKHSAKMGTIKAAAGKDAQVALDGGETVLLKRSILAWLHERT